MTASGPDPSQFGCCRFCSATGSMRSTRMHFFLFCALYPSSSPSHTRTHKHTHRRRNILLLISLLHICLLVVFAPLTVSLSINKALIAFSLECDLARLRAVFLWLSTLEDPFGLLHFSSLRRLLSKARCQLSATQAVTHKDDAAGRRKENRKEKKNSKAPGGLHRQWLQKRTKGFRRRRRGLRAEELKI